MSQKTIKYAFHTILKKEMDIEEYYTYLNEELYREKIKPLKCIECGDEIILRDGPQRTYFCHIPCKDGHNYCSLYHKGYSSLTEESILRKKMLKESDISLNFELHYFDNKWESILTIPPFEHKELIDNISNETVISVKPEHSRDNNTRIININSNSFNKGRIKKLIFKEIIPYFKICFKGRNTNKLISFEFQGFRNYSTSIYSTLISHEYSKKNGKIDLSKVKDFIIKRKSGKIVTNVHYIIIRNETGLSSRNIFFKKMSQLNIELNEIIFNNSIINNDNIKFYDIVFKSINEKSKFFCEERNCYLSESNEVRILWPPVKTFGNYKFNENKNEKMFLSFENKLTNLALIPIDTEDMNFRIANSNFNTFYVTNENIKIQNRKSMSIKYDYCKYLKLENKDYFLYKNGVLVKKLFGEKVNIPSEDEVLEFKSKLDIIIHKNKEKESIRLEKFKNAIKYTNKKRYFGNDEYKRLLERNKKNVYIRNYLNICFEKKEILQDALLILLEESR